MENDIFESTDSLYKTLYLEHDNNGFYYLVNNDGEAIAEMITESDLEETVGVYKSLGYYICGMF